MAEPRVTSEIQAANLALGHCKQPEIGFFPPTEASLRAREAHKWFGTVRDALLCDHPWNWAGWRIVPAAAPLGSLNERMPYRYPLPAECLEVRSVDHLSHDEWEMEAVDPTLPNPPQMKILVTSRAPPVTVEITARVTNVALWEPLFVECFALRLAAAMAPKLLRNENRALELLAEAEAKLKRAQMSDRRERSRSGITRQTSYITVRR